MHYRPCQRAPPPEHQPPCFGFIVVSYSINSCTDTGFIPLAN